MTTTRRRLLVTTAIRSRWQRSATVLAALVLGAALLDGAKTHCFCLSFHQIEIFLTLRHTRGAHVSGAVPVGSRQGGEVVPVGEKGEETAP